MNDVRVKPQESEQIVDALQRHNIPVTYVTFADEGHGFVREENRLAFTAVTEAFLALYLDGDTEPVGDSFTVTVRRSNLKRARSLFPDCPRNVLPTGLRHRTDPVPPD
jgi:hypothetical protein